MNEKEGLKEWKDPSTGEVYRLTFSQEKLLERIKLLLGLVAILLIIVAVIVIAFYIKIDSLNIVKICYQAMS